MVSVTFFQFPARFCHVFGSGCPVLLIGLLMLWGFFLYIVIMQDAFLWYKSYKLEEERKEKKNHIKSDLMFYSSNCL